MGELLKKITTKAPFAILFVLYLKTILPSVDFWDTGEFQTIGYTFDISHPTGYPSYIILLKFFTNIFPFGNIAFRANFLSLILSILGLVFLSKTIKLITKNQTISLLAPIVLGTTRTLWLISIKADPHIFHFFLFSLFIYISILIIKEGKNNLLTILGLVVGVSLGNHLLSLFWIPSFIFIIFSSKTSKKERLLSTSFLFLSLLLYAIIPIIYKIKGAYTIDYDLTSFNNLKKYILGLDFSPQKSLVLSHQSLLNLIKALIIIKEELTKVTFYISIIGIPAFLLKEKISYSVLVMFVLNIFFSANYSNAAIERYFITNNTILILIYSFTLNLFIQKLNKTKVNRVINTLLELSIIVIFILIPIYKNIYKNYNLVNQSQNNRAEIWARSVFENVEENAVIFSWWSYSTPLWYLKRIEKLRPDIMIINEGQNKWEEMAKNFVNQKPVYFIEKINLKDKNLNIKQEGNIYKLEIIN